MTVHAVTGTEDAKSSGAKIEEATRMIPVEHADEAPKSLTRSQLLQTSKRLLAIVESVPEEARDALVHALLLIERPLEKPMRKAILLLGRLTDEDAAAVTEIVARAFEIDADTSREQHGA